MQKMNLAVLGTAALALALGAGAARAQMSGGTGPRMGRAEGMARFLGLSEAQKFEVRKLMEGRRAEHEALREQVEANSEELKKALESASPVPAEVGELAIEGHRLREQGRAHREAQEKAIRSLLTPEQQTKFDAMKAMRHGDGPRGPRP